MGKIDDPLNQVEFQNREEGLDVVTVALNVASPIVALLNAPIGATTAIVTFLRQQYWAEPRREARGQAVQSGLVEAFREFGGRLDDVENKIAGPDAEEAVSVGLQRALSAARLDKARRFGRILGATLAQDAPDWKEATEFIRTLEEFSEPDVEALRVFWRVQHSGWRVVGAEPKREMSTDANDYTQTWTGVLDHAMRAGLAKDDWYARCARLSGFGLVIPVQANMAYQGSDGGCYRITGRAVRLLHLLGMFTDPRKYPAVRYHATNPPRTVQDETEDRALGEGWADTPAAFYDRK